MLPNYIIIGVPAGGTSFMSTAILQHPDLYLPKEFRPEPHYFYKSWEYEKPLSYYEEKYFSEVKGEKAVGERSSSYLFHPQCAERIFKALPNAKLISTLRNPIERTYANWRYTVMHGLDPLPFEEALENEDERIKAQKGQWAEIQPHNYTGRGFYHEHLMRYLKYFKRDKILLIKSEAMGKDPQTAFKSVFRFLEIDDSFTPTVGANFSCINVKVPQLQADLREYFGGDKFNELIECLRREEDPHDFVESDEHHDKVNELQANVLPAKQPMPQKCREFLRGVFADDIEKLKTLVDFSVDDWN